MNQFSNQGFGGSNTSYGGGGNLMSQSNVPLPQANVGLSGSIHNKRRWDDEVRWFDFPDKQMVTLRFFGPVFATYNHWMKTKQGQRFPLCCPAYDQTTQNFAAGKCAICDDFNIPSIVEAAKNLNPSFNEEFDPNLKELKSMKARINGLTQVIIRNISNLNDPTLHARPWHPIRLGPLVFFTLLKLKNMNICNINGKQYQADIADPYWGRDIHVLYNSAEKNPSQKYMINLGDHTPLTELEKTYLRDMYDWSSLVEYATHEETKRSLQINGYYQVLNLLTSGTPAFAQEHNTQYAQYETYLKPPMPPTMDEAQGMPQQRMPQQPRMQPPQPMMAPQPQMPTNTPNTGYMQSFQQPAPHNPPQPQTAPMGQPGGYGTGYGSYQPPQQQVNNYVPPPLVTPPNMNMAGLTQVDNMPPVATPVPTYVAPPLGYNTSIPTQEGDIEIPFDGPERTYPIKGQSVSKAEFNSYVSSFASTLSRGQPVQVASSGELAGANVPACYGDYQGDTSCLRCPLRMFCVHV